MKGELHPTKNHCEADFRTLRVSSCISYGSFEQRCVRGGVMADGVMHACARGGGGGLCFAAFKDDICGWTQ